MIVGSGGGGGGEGEGEWPAFCEDIEPGEASFLCVRNRVVRACWSSETRVKDVVLGRWRCASLIVSELVDYRWFERREGQSLIVGY